MKKVLSVFLSVIIILSVFSFSAFSLTSGNYTYVLENGKAVITGYSGSASTLTVPATLGGYEVFAVGEGAFSNNKKLTQITVSEGICEIRANAFRSCTALAVINLPSTITRFGKNAVLDTAYYNNKSNWTIRPENLNSGGGVSVGNGQDSISIDFIRASVLEYLYLGTVLVKCIIVGSYSIKPTTTVIADNAFEGQEKLKNLDLCAKLVTIGACAFKDCTSFKSVTVKDSVKIYENAFLNTGIYNNAANWRGDVFCIGTRALMPSASAEELNISDGVTYISMGAVGAKNVYIPASVTKIDIDAFSGNSSVIYGYSGTYAESFALSNSFTFVDLDNIFAGDMDYDGVLTSNDYAILNSSVISSRKMTKYEKLAGDMNLDGAVDAFDVIYIQLLINDRTARAKGDINGDGQINRNDYTFLSNAVRGNCATAGDNYLYRADLNGDGVLDAFDVIYLDLYLNGKVSI